jgi:hypothetical protein
MKVVFKRALVIGAEIVLLLFFALGAVDAVVTQEVTAFLVLYITSATISGLLLIGWLIRKLREQLWFWRVNLIWTVGWSLYFLMIIIMVVVAMNQLSSLG